MFRNNVRSIGSFGPVSIQAFYNTERIYKGHPLLGGRISTSHKTCPRCRCILGVWARGETLPNEFLNSSEHTWWPKQLLRGSSHALIADICR
jgi:hypothetical protein